MKHILIALILAATPLHAGGPVILEETAEAAPDRDNSWVVPVIVGLLILGALASGGGDDAPADPGKDPQPCTFNGDGC